MGQVNCCEHANNENFYTEQIDTQNDFQSEKQYIKKQNTNTIKAVKENKPNILLSKEDASLYKIQSVVRRFLIKSKFLKRFQNQKQFLADYFKNQAILCEYDEISKYIHPNVLVIEKMIKNREGMYNNVNIPKNILQKIEYKSNYCIEMPCVYLTEIKETEKSNRDNRDNSIFEDTDVNTTHEIQFNTYPVYKGFWSIDKKKNGYGIHINKDGSKYEGIFRNGKLDGKGRYITVRGDFFEGNFSDGFANGQGIFIHSDGSIYTGNWVRDTPFGEGQEWTSDGSYYHGEFLQGKKCGVGEFKWKDESTYVGGVKNDKLNGEGLYIWSDGKKYRGFWSDNAMHGFGILEYTDGTRYEGNFENNKRNGKGKFYYNEFKYYDGNWVNGKQHGKGKIVKNDKVEEGEWFEGKKIKN